MRWLPLIAMLVVPALPAQAREASERPPANPTTKVEKPPTDPWLAQANCSKDAKEEAPQHHRPFSAYGK